MNRREFIVGATAAGLMPAAVAEEVPAGLKVRFLGTGAADWWGRDQRGELRRLTSVLIDSAVLVDFTKQAGDMLPKGVRPEVIFYTHSHGDHYQPADALKVGVKRVYAHESWAAEAKKEFAAAAEKLGVACPEVSGLVFGEPVEERGIRFTCVPSNHATHRTYERTGMYLLEKGKTRLLYATDTGGIMAEASRMVGIDAHGPGKPITGLVMEATMGIGYEDDYRAYSHSSVATVAHTVRVLQKTERYLPKPGQKVYLTHMARTMHGTQAEIEKAVPAPLCPAYDGLEVVF